jgi:hypothetical protein
VGLDVAGLQRGADGGTRGQLYLCQEQEAVRRGCPAGCRAGIGLKLVMVSLYLVWPLAVSGLTTCWWLSRVMDHTYQSKHRPI